MKNLFVLDTGKGWNKKNDHEGPSFLLDSFMAIPVPMFPVFLLSLFSCPVSKADGSGPAFSFTMDERQAFSG